MSRGGNIQGVMHLQNQMIEKCEKGGVFLIITNQITIFVVIRWYAIVFECYILGDWHFILHNPSVVIATTPIEFIIFTTLTFDMVNRSI